MSSSNEKIKMLKVIIPTAPQRSLQLLHKENTKEPVFNWSIKK